MPPSGPSTITTSRVPIRALWLRKPPAVARLAGRSASAESSSQVTAGAVAWDWAGVVGAGSVGDGPGAAGPGAGPSDGSAAVPGRGGTEPASLVAGTRAPRAF